MHRYIFTDQYRKTIQILTDRQALMESIRSKIHFVRKQTIEFSYFFEQQQKTTRNLSKQSASFLCLSNFT